MLTGRDEAVLAEDAAAVGSGSAARRRAVALDLRRAGRGRRRSSPRCSASLWPARHPRQQCRHDQARRFPDAARRGLGGGVRAQILRPCAARARGVADAVRQQGLARHHRRHRGQAADRQLDHRRLGQCRRQRLLPRRWRSSATRPASRSTCVSPGHVDTDRLQRRIDVLEEGDGARRGRRARALSPDAGREPARACPRTSPTSSPSSPRRTAAGCTARSSICMAARSSRSDGRERRP